LPCKGVGKSPKGKEKHKKRSRCRKHGGWESIKKQEGNFMPTRGKTDKRGHPGRSNPEIRLVQTKKKIRQAREKEKGVQVKGLKTFHKWGKGGDEAEK